MHEWWTAIHLTLSWRGRVDMPQPLSPERKMIRALCFIRTHPHHYWHFIIGEGCGKYTYVSHMTWSTIPIPTSIDKGHGKIVKWLETVKALKSGATKSELRSNSGHDTPTAVIGLAGTNQTSSVYDTVAPCVQQQGDRMFRKKDCVKHTHPLLKKI